MMTRYVTAAAAIAALSVPIAAQDAKTVIANASKAMGVDTLRTVEFSATGLDFALGQAYNPASPWPKFIEKKYTRAVDFQAPASRVDRVRAQGENPPRGGGLQPIVGDQTQSQTIVVSAGTPWPQQLEIVMLPHGFLRAAAAANATVKPQKVGGKTYSVVSFKGQNGAAVNGYIADNLVEKVETWVDNALYGDMPFEATYAGYKDFGGIKFPTRIVQKQGGYPIFDLTVSDVKPNAAVAIQAPQGQPAAPPPLPPATSEKLADGVYLILGGYASVAVDFKDYIVVVEGPQSEARATAIIAEAKRLIPNKPIKYVVNTHHHIDHSSGLRPFVAEGATIVTHEINKPYFERVLTLPHTLNPDRLAQTKAKPTFETMTEKKVLSDGSRVVELHHVKDSGHNEGLVMAYLPKEKILIEADSFNPPPQPPTQAPAQVSPYTANLVENLDRLKLDVERIVPIHYPADARKVLKPELLLMVRKQS
jgi:glyoxylase-like metal-dependent hydrolase (beta-lactamase superfamily II)